MKKSILFGLVLIPVIFLMVGCGNTGNDNVTLSDVDLPGAQTQSPPTQPPETQTPDDCEVYEGLELDIVVHTILDGDTTVTLYSKFPDEEAALADEALGYFATLGGKECLESRVFEGEDYIGRVYHICKISKGDYNALRHYMMFREGCDEAVHDVPMLSLMVEGGETTSGSGGSGGSSGGLKRWCGIMPEPLCAGKYEDWCDCKGGTFSCIDPSLQIAVCWLP